MNLFLENRCLICHEPIRPTVGWRAIISIEREQPICSACEGKLEKVEGETCRICSRPFKLLDTKFRKGDLCHDCERWEEDQDWQGFLEKNNSLFLYNDFLKEVLAKFKFRGDYALAGIFAGFIK